MKAASRLSAGALALALAIPALAATLPQPRTEHGITWLSGGVGEDQSAALKAEAKRYPLSLVFTGKGGEYLAEVPVKIVDHAGKTVLDTTSKGPIMLVKLPPGRYQIAATRQGKTLHRSALVKAKGERQVVFRWPQA